MTIQLGNRVRDKVTGFVGIATSRIEYITGCIQYGVLPPVKPDGGYPNVEYIDEQRLSVDGSGIDLTGRDSGGPQRDAPRT